MRPRRPPKSISILSQRVALKALPESQLPEVYGQWKQRPRRIEYRTRMSPFDTVDTILHEVFHAVLAHQGRFYEKAVEERYVTALATGFTTVLKDNPEFRQWIDQTIQHAK